MNTLVGAFSYSDPYTEAADTAAAPMLVTPGTIIDILLLLWGPPADETDADMAACGGRTENRLTGGLTSPLPIIFSL